MTNSERNLKYRFNDLQICDISLPTGKYKEEVESIYCSLDCKNHFAGKNQKQPCISMYDPSSNENSDNKMSFANVHQ